MKAYLRYVLIVAGTSAALCSPRPTPAEPLPSPVLQTLAAQRIPPTALSIVVRDTATGETLLAHNPAVARSPASTIKVVTTYAALDELGPNYVWQTRALATGPLVDGHVRGDLVLKGGGDPFMTTERWERFARELRFRGVTHIDGDVVVDNTLFEPQTADPDDFDGKGYKTYNVLPDALLVNLQTVEFRLVPDKKGIAIVMDPEPDNFRVINKIRPLQTACRSGAHALQFADESPTQITLEGPLSVHCEGVSLRRAIMRGPEFAYGTFVTNFRDAGGTIGGHLKVAAAPPSAHLLVSYESLTLAEVVRLINKFSNNPMARALLLTLAAERGGAPGTLAKGASAVADWMARREISCPELVLDNGSGLSRVAHISAACMTQVLTSAWKSRYFPEFAASLPLGGEDGTLKHRFSDTKGLARIRMKTGHLKDVAALAGWVTTASGRTLAVTVFINHPGAEYGDGDKVIDAVVHWALER